MKIAVSWIFFIVLFLSNGYADVEVSKSANLVDCFCAYRDQVQGGHNAMAIVKEGPFYICGFSWGYDSMKVAVDAALENCEKVRLTQKASMQVKRVAMTHCRIYAFNELD